jgi:hypothetical protein
MIVTADREIRKPAGRVLVAAFTLVTSTDVAWEGADMALAASKDTDV